jgi:hypothetical protein
MSLRFSCAASPVIVVNQMQSSFDSSFDTAWFRWEFYTLVLGVNWTIYNTKLCMNFVGQRLDSSNNENKFSPKLSKKRKGDMK